MPQAVTFNNTSYNIPLSGELNWSSLSNFLIAVANNAGVTNFQKQSIRVATATPVTISATTDCMIETNLSSPGAVTVNLPAGTTGQIFMIVDGKGDANTNNITINGNGGQQINGASSTVIDHARGAVILSFDGTQWQIIDRTVPEGTITTSDLASAFVLGTTKGGTGQNSSATFPTSGVIVTEAASETLINKTINGANNTLTIRAANDITGQLPIANGGTNATTANSGFNNLSPMTTLGDIVYENAAPAAARLAGNTTATKNFLTQTGTGSVSAAPAWGSIASGDLPAATTGAQGAIKLVAPTVQKFTTGSGTYTTPAGVLYIVVRAQGGGGGGGGGGASGSAGNGTAGGNTTFGTSLITANGGSAGLASASATTSGGSATINSPAVTIRSLAGGSGSAGNNNDTSVSILGVGGQGGNSFNGCGGAGSTNSAGGTTASSGSGSGGGGAGFSFQSASALAGDGGGAGAYAEAMISSPSATYSYAVGSSGSGGAAGTSGFAGGNGGQGDITVTEYYY